MPDTSDTYLTIPHMVSPLSPLTCLAKPLLKKKTSQPFPLDYTQTLLSLLDILSAFYAKLAKLLGPSPFPHASQHMLGLSPHPGVSYLFQNQNQISPADKALWSVAIGLTALGNPLGGSVLSSPLPSWMPALGELVLKVDSKFKVRQGPPPPLPPPSDGWVLTYDAFNRVGRHLIHRFSLFFSFLFALRKLSRCYSRTWTCSRGTASRTSLPRSIRSFVMLVGGVPRQGRTNLTRREPSVACCIIASREDPEGTQRWGGRIEFFTEV